MSEKFEESIKQYYLSKGKDLEYLDLAIPKSEKLIRNKIEFYCFEKGFEHRFHTENQQLNLIADCQYQGLHNIAYIRDQIALLSKVSVKSFLELKTRVRELENECSQLRKTQKQQPTKAEVAEFISSTFEQPKKVEAEALKLVKRLDQKIQQVEGLVNKLAEHLL